MCGFAYSSDEDMCSWVEGQIEVLLTLTHVGGFNIVSHDSPMSLQSFFGSLPEPHRVQAEPARKKPPAVPRASEATLAAISDHPWAMAYLQEGRDTLRRSGGDASVGEASDDEADEELEPEEAPIELSEEAMVEVDKVMNRARAEVIADHYGAFRVKPLGGDWLAMHAGIAIDAWQSTAVGGAVAEWCARYHLQSSARFDISLYGNGGALTCARFWAQKSAFFYQLWQAAGEPHIYSFSEADIRSFSEPASFTDLMAQCDAPKAQRRFAQLRSMRPVGPGA